LFSVIYPYIARYASGLVKFLSMLGRNSLYVFCVGSVLSLAGQIVRFMYRAIYTVTPAVIICGILIMALTAMASGMARKHQGPFERALCTLI